MSNTPTSRGSVSPGPAPEHNSGSAAVAWAVGEGKGEDLIRQVEARVRRTRRRRATLAATCLVAAFLIAGVGMFRQPEGSNVAVVETPASALVSLPPKQILPDGTVVELNVGAEIDVQFSGVLRQIVLRNGEAHFQVTKDASRPFVVAAGGVEVRAVGTAFAVQLGSRSVEVVVTEGTVAVDQPRGSTPGGSAGAEIVGAGPVAPLATVEAGNRVVIEIGPVAAAAKPVAIAVSQTEIGDRLAWRVPRIEFSGTPLAEAIPMFNQYSGTMLVLDPALGHLQMSGVLRADNIDSLLRLLKNEFGIEPERRGENEIHLRRSL